MSKLLKQAMAMMRELPDDVQDTAVRQLMQYVDQISTLSDRDTVAEGRDAFERGEFISLDQWMHEQIAA